MSQKPATIFINPRFKNAHINPNFLPNNKILVNPNFLSSQAVAEIQQLQPAPPPLPIQSAPACPVNGIIKNTRRTLIRSSAPAPRPTLVESNHSDAPQQHLIKISKTKLVTAGHLMKQQQKKNEIIKSTTESLIKTRKFQRKAESKESIYKLDRRHPQSPKKKKIVNTYSIRRVSPTKVKVSDDKLWVDFSSLVSARISNFFSAKGLRIAKRLSRSTSAVSYTIQRARN